MTQPTLLVQTPGLLSTVQDMGRPGFGAQGVPVCGALDTWAASVANLLVGNSPRHAVLEITLTGPTLQALCPATLALCGANLTPTLDNAPAAMWHTLRMDAGQTLRFGRRQCGARTYLAVAGGFDVPEILGSRATFLRGAFGGLGGRALRPGDILCAAGASASRDAPDCPCGLRPADIPDYPEIAALRVVPGPHEPLFDPQSIHTFYSQPYVLTPQSDRMGCRLEGPRLALHPGAADTLPSEATAAGAVQIAGGQPLLLMADRQTTGGYPMLGVVAAADLPRAAQCAPGTLLRFSRVSVADAQTLLREQRRFLRILEGAARAR